MRWPLGFVAVAAGLAACATPAQVERVEAHVGVLEQHEAHADSVRAAESARVMAAQQRLLDSLAMSVRALQDNIAAGGRENEAHFSDVRRLIATLADASNATQARVNQAIAQMDARDMQMAAAAATPPASNDTTHSAGTTAPLSPSADALYEQGRTDLLKGSNTSAQMVFHSLIQTYPTSPFVPAALLGLGESFDPAQPDSARAYYQQVVKTYPDSAAVPLYKLAQIEERRTPPNLVAAKAFYQQIVTDRYKSSDVYGLAVDWLQKHP
ncbi:MAG TPA: tetratricopeptide repeat protein [Gemmatimonadales bacterium]|jgi:TolA-binding protein|nr:tetratricopeptide repeat protein [Gemmatimonadales bacterium]